MIASVSVLAAPPVDLVPKDSRKMINAKPITENDLVYTDNTANDTEGLSTTFVLKYDVVGRSLPGRQGKPMLKLKAGDRVEVIKDSKDGRWQAVETLFSVSGRGRRKAWVPKNTLEPPKTPSKVKAGEGLQDSEDTARQKAGEF
jgi:hypothetical protein